MKDKTGFFTFLFLKIELFSQMFDEKIIEIFIRIPCGLCDGNNFKV